MPLKWTFLLGEAITTVVLCHGSVNAKNPARALSLWRITIDVDSVKV